MVALAPRLIRGLVLSLSLSSTLFLHGAAQTTTVKPSSTAPVTPVPTNAPVPGHAPVAFTGLASSSNSQTIYYQGGQINSATVLYSSELWALDVTKGWAVSSPAWTNLTSPNAARGPAVGGHSGTMSKDGKTFMVTAPSGNAANPFLYQYDVSSATWSSSSAPAAQAALWAGRREAYFVTDPSTGNIWYIGGSSQDGSSINEVDRLQGTTWTPALNVTAPGGSSSTINNLSSGTAHISGPRIYVFGGYGSVGGQRGYQSFQSLPWVDVSSADAPTFGMQLTQGPIPPSRQDHCSVLTNSKKVIVYGGWDANSKTTFNDIWLLDMVTWTWSQVIPVTTGTRRYGHNCDLVGANMVVYGGLVQTATGSLSGYGQDIQVYDIMQSTWMQTYAPKQDTTPITSLPSGNGGSSSGGLSGGALAGIVCGVLVVLGLVIGAVLYKRRQKQIQIKEAEMEKEAYLASLRPENNDNKTAPHSPSSPTPARILQSVHSNSPGMHHQGAYHAMDELLLQNSPMMNGQSIGGQSPGQGNVQYLMQQLPDGTIAVQPVYLDHQPLQMQPSPNMIAGVSGEHQNNTGSYISPPAAGSPMISSAGYFAPPAGSSSHNNNNTNIFAYGSPVSDTSTAIFAGGAANPYAMPPTSQAKPQAGLPQPSQDPFASPHAQNVPLPPGFVPSGADSSPNQQYRVM
ncbi:hypothetical protein BGZ83_007808 [Gryganskiella cystojenkinii]|nr:hypothetical protein BGZ83_007808 [Gryganskiella cystojenkinii]